MEESHTCQRCSNAIDSQECVKVEGHFFHVECFTCKSCSKDIAGQEYIKHDDDFYCPPCYVEAHAPQCTACSKPIQGKFSQINDAPYHNECLKCDKCSNQIGTEYFKNGQGFICQQCQLKDALVCQECAKPILGDKISTMGQNWHNQCFICAICKKEIGDEQVTAKNQKPCHLKCTQATCDLCQNPIQSDVFYENGGQNYHLECKQEVIEKQNGEQQAEEMRLRQEEFKRQKLEEEQTQRLREEERRKLERLSLEEKEKNAKKQQQQKKSQSPVKKNQSPVKQQEPKETSSPSPSSSDAPQIDSSRTRYPLKDLQARPPIIQGIDYTKQELYLSDEDFKSVFNMKIEQFYEQQKWKQDELKKKFGLF